MKNWIKLPKSNPKSNIKIAIIAGIVLFSLVIPKIVYGIDPLGIAENFGKQMLLALTDAIFFFLSQILTVAAAFFEGMLTIGLKSALDTIKIGWGIARDFSNMLFVLFLVIIAFATILRIEHYGIKQLLPKVIIIALLINFSFVIAGVIIDFSNIAAGSFINDIRGKISGEGGISGTFADALKIGQTRIVFSNCEDLYNYLQRQCEETYPPLTEEGRVTEERENYDKCIDDASKKYDKCLKQDEATVEASDANFLNIIFSMIFGSLVLLVAAFALAAGGVLLLFRMMTLWLLTIVVPFVFICYIMPGLQRIWRMWWSTFLKWCFFAPAYAFFVWIAIYVALHKGHEKLAYQAEANIGIYGVTITGFTGDPASQLISYGIIIAFLLGGIIMASKIGIYGAGATMNIVQKAGRGARTWATRTGMRPVKTVGRTVGAGALTAGGALFGGTRLGRRMKAKATQLRRRPEEYPEHKKYMALLKTMSNENVIKEIKNRLGGVRRLDAAKEALSRGALQKTKDRDAVRSAIKVLSAYKYMKEANDLKQSRFGVIEKDDERAEEWKKLKAKGIHKDIRPRVFKDEPGEEAGKKAVKTVIQSEATITDLITTLKQMRTDTQDQFAKSLLPIIYKDNSFDEENKKQRSAYAAITGKIHVAFTNTDTGKIEDKALGEFVRNMKPQNFADIDKDSIKYIAKHVDAAAASEISRYISGQMKEEFMNNFREGVRESLKKDPRWQIGRIVNLKEKKDKTNEEIMGEEAEKARKYMKEE